MNTHFSYLDNSDQYFYFRKKWFQRKNVSKQSKNANNLAWLKTPYFSIYL